MWSLAILLTIGFYMGEKIYVESINIEGLLVSPFPGIMKFLTELFKKRFTCIQLRKEGCSWHYWQGLTNPRIASEWKDPLAII